MIGRAVRVALGCGVLAVSALPACGGNSSNGAPPGGSGGAGTGSGGAGTGSGGAGAGGKSDSGTAGDTALVEPVPCGTKKCEGLVIAALQNIDIPGCCADAATNSCGLDSSALAAFNASFSEACQPLAQPGALDTSCADSPSQAVSGVPAPISFKGCCRPSHTCGFLLDTILGLLPLGLGCVDSTPFLDGGTPATCGNEAGGDGGMGGAGASQAGAAGAPAGAGGT